MNISLPDTLKSIVDERVSAGGYGSHSEYVRELVRRDEREAAKDHMRALIAAGLASPQGRPWSELRDGLLKQAKSKKAK